MENRIFSHFNIYDQIGFLLVGSVALIVIYFDSYIMLDVENIPGFNLSNSLVWFIIAYFTGHVVQAISNIFIKDDKHSFSDSEQEVLDKAQSYFKVENRPLNEIYQLCYMLSYAKDITGHVRSFNAYHSLYRGWVIVFSIQSIWLLIF